ncbi:MAG: response regulator [Acidobacteriaceae bacterium]
MGATKTIAQDITHTALGLRKRKEPMAQKLVLLVEAEQPEGLSARKMIVESLHHRVVMAHNGKEALSLIECLHPDIVLIHSHIEGQSCEEITSEIRRLHPDLKVVALVPGANSLCGPVTTLNSMEPQELVRFFRSTADAQPG